MQETICIGGPLHGAKVDLNKGPTFQTHMDSTYKCKLANHNLSFDEVAEVRIIATLYHRRELNYNVGPLTLRGPVYVWHEVEELESVHRIALGMLIADAMTDKDATR